jgi:predicted TIM-barrel enzyme
MMYEFDGHVKKSLSLTPECITCVTAVKYCFSMMDSIAAEALRYRKNIGCSAKIFADVHIKHRYPLAQRPIELAAEDCWHRGLADAVIITGLKTGVFS